MLKNGKKKKKAKKINGNSFFSKFLFMISGGTLENIDSNRAKIICAVITFWGTVIFVGANFVNSYLDKFYYQDKIIMIQENKDKEKEFIAATGQILSDISIFKLSTENVLDNCSKNSSESKQTIFTENQKRHQAHDRIVTITLKNISKIGGINGSIYQNIKILANWGDKNQNNLCLLNQSEVRQFLNIQTEKIVKSIAKYRIDNFPQ